VGYPSATSSVSTSTVNTLTVATTTTTTIYTPFANYVDASSTVTTYFTLNGTLVGAYTYQKGNEASTGKLTFIHVNYLGTPVLETDDKGDIVQMDITDAFGNYVQRDQRKDNAYHNKSYTSHEFDDVTGLTYAKARYLDTPSHSFLSVDPVIYDLSQDYLNDPQQMNSYAYARNNPIVYKDPNGKWIESGLDIAFLSYDLNELREARENGTASWKNYAYIAGDSVGLALPGVTGVGLGMRAVGRSDDAFKVLQQSGKEILVQSEKMGGHAIAKHVGKTGTELIQRSVAEPKLQNISTFTDIKEASKALKTTLNQNKSAIESFTNSSKQSVSLTGKLPNNVGQVYNTANQTLSSSNKVQLYLSKTKEGILYVKSLFPFK
jgi:RHS repeat-associated protein